MAGLFNSSRLTGTALLLAVLALPGCKKPIDPDAEVTPKIGELGARRATVTTQPADAAAIQLLVQRLEFAGRLKLDDAVNLLDTDLIDAQTQSRWRANGLRIATLPLTRVEEFTKALPPAAAQGIRQLKPGGRADFLRAAPPLTEPATIQATMKSDTPDTTRLPKGQPQWRVDAPPTGARPDGGLAFRITPHHHFIKPSAIPRQPDEVVFDGTLFERLAATIQLPPGHVLVIWWDRPEVLPFPKETVFPMRPAEDVLPKPETPERTEGEDSPPPESEPALPPGMIVQVVPTRAAIAAAAATQPGEPTGPLRPPLIGDLLMVSMRFGKPLQSMLIFSRPQM